ncbi:MAG: hypothetical protein K2M93_03305 [Muribaculaceae bacterium]|nr:hypothetical protein [Muribaculaceae bacterium]
MDSVEILFPDNEGNHLVVVLYFYDDIDKVHTFQIPQDFSNLDIADININKLDMDKPLKISVFFKMSNWLLDQFLLYPNAVFSFICSTDPLETHKSEKSPEEVRWNLFEFLYLRKKSLLDEMGIKSKDIVVGPDGYQTFARVFYRDKHAHIIHLVIAHLTNKYKV